MITTIDALLKTEAYKKNGIIYPHPKDLIMRAFVDKLTNSGLTIEVPQVTVDKEGGAGTEEHTDVITWGRGLVVIPTKFENEELGLKQVFGIIWSYDTSKPVIKLFHGAQVRACMNLMVSAEEVKEIPMGISFKSDVTNKEREKIVRRKFEDVEELVAERMEEWIASAEAKFTELVATVNLLKSFTLPTLTNLYSKDRDYDLNPKSGLKLESVIGILYLHDVVRGQFDYSTFNYAFQLLYDDRIFHENKALYNRANVDGPITLWHIHNAMTQRLTDGRVDIDFIANKSYYITKLLLNITNYKYAEV
jgi:hypothetical protein